MMIDNFMFISFPFTLLLFFLQRHKDAKFFFMPIALSLVPFPYIDKVFSKGILFNKDLPSVNSSVYSISSPIPTPLAIVVTVIAK